jgi:hypothetical protein
MRWVLLTVLVATVACGARAQGGGSATALELLVRADWAADAAWDDGRAEVATYRAERPVDGEPMAHTLHLVTQAEDFNKQYWTRADWPHGQKPLMAVLAHHQIATVPTATTPLQTMISIFFERRDVGRAVKVSAGTMEWRGMTFKEFEFWRNPPVFRYSSFRDGEGTGAVPLAGFDNNTFVEEELHLLVRALRFGEGAEAWLRVTGPQATSRAAVPEAVPARLVVERETEAVTVPAGTWAAEALWRVTLETRDGRLLRWRVATEAPQALVEFTSSDGRRFELESLERRAWWQSGG